MSARSARNAVSPPPEVLAYASGYECPDCLAEKQLELRAAGVWHLAVVHADTCPLLRRLEGLS